MASPRPKTQFLVGDPVTVKAVSDGSVIAAVN